MSDDAVAQVRRAISTPVNTMTVVTVASSKQASDILRTVAEDLHDRPWSELPMPCTEGAVGTLLRTARQLTQTWPPEEGVLFLSDATPPHRSPASGVAFWRAMNLQRENWAGLNCHLVFLLTLQNYEQLLTVADHLASWIPIKLDARQNRKQYPIIGDAKIPGTQSKFQDQDVTSARYYLEELEQGLAKTLQEDEEVTPIQLLRRYYLPMIEAALKANLLERADTLGKNINPDDVPEPDKPRWWQARCNTLIRLFRFDEARVEAEKYLLWAQRIQNAQEEGNATTALGEILRTAGKFAAALPYLKQAVQLSESVYSPDNPNLAIRINYLGLVLWNLGDLAGARTQFERALSIVENAYGTDHPNAAVIINNLGSVLHAMGDLAGAKTYLERALRIDEAAYGPEHPDVARDLNNLGLVLFSLGDLEGARMYYERALKIDEAVYDPASPGVAVALINLAKVLWKTGNLSGAREYVERALRIDEAAFGQEHPNVARDVHNLGGVLYEMGDLSGARAHYERALQMDEAVYGPEHPEVARTVNNLGLLLQELGDLAAARAHFERALAIRRRFLGDDHPDTIRVERDLAALGE